MENIKNLDLRKLAPFERHKQIFDNWNSLEIGKILRIINDHEPKPLYYQFNAEHKGEFEWDYERKGPEDWIFKIKKISGKDKKAKIKELIRKLHSEEDMEKIKEEGRELFANISPLDLGLIEQEIISEGISKKEMRKLCDVHLEVMKENIIKKDFNLRQGHPVHTFMKEHEEILDFIEKLKIIVKKIGSSESFDDLKMELRMLEYVSSNLVGADKHHKREEEALFPAMRKHNITEPPEIMKEEHEELIPKKQILLKLAEESNKMQFKEFAEKVKENADYIIKELPNHIYKEDNILYPMALEVLSPEEWNQIKKECDEIGYCCFSPEC